MKYEILPAVSHPTKEPAPRQNPIALPIPAKLRQDIPLSSAARSTVANARRDIAQILNGEDRDRVLVVCGPCSIDDANAALVYAEKLGKLSERVRSKALLIMRTYFEKPRSVVGWKGLLYDPMIKSERSAASGLTIARRLLTRINDMGVPCATEFLNPLLSLYLEDGIAYGSIGSRTVESQIHREMASRMEMPIGMKNGMDGDPVSALNGVRSARAPHSFFGSSLSGAFSLVETSGNPLAHVVLRGGSQGPNYHPEFVNQTVSALADNGLERPVIVDCSHGNSNKDHRRQPMVARDAMRQFGHGQIGIGGIMLESYLVEGRQNADASTPKTFGQSITDACIGWKDTQELILAIADQL